MGDLFRRRSIAAPSPKAQRLPNNEDFLRRRSIAALPPKAGRPPNDQDLYRRHSIAAPSPKARRPPNEQDYFRQGVPNYNTGGGVYDSANAMPVPFEDKTEDGFSVFLRSMASHQGNETNDDEFSAFLDNIANPQHDSAALPLSSNDETNNDEL